ncbi:NVEALA domain-containing protein [Capnocytophaga cynodegmi]|uniref:NVEALA family protein n=1 Tax=Capnocytophaga cynodegmi TaxID=28189 RepID=A0A0B7HAU8_9FLAO|nr:NVEALA domain-containing protein [Capnocytophaga cynodegmi]CEN36761.1 conserved exported hypothetical protein [Capnocytophaga cynodegmi]
MKKNFLKGVIATAVVALVAGYGINKSMSNSGTELSDLSLTNVEALAQDESGSSIPSFPCIESPGNTCTFLGKDAIGKMKWFTLSDHIKK